MRKYHLCNFCVIFLYLGSYWDGWYPPPSYYEDLNVTFNYLSLTVKCDHDIPVVSNHCDSYCLFNIDDDPCEVNDLSKEFPDILATLKKRLDIYRQSIVPPRNNMTINPR